MKALKDVSNAYLLSELIELAGMTDRMLSYELDAHYEDISAVKSELLRRLNT